MIYLLVWRVKVNAFLSNLDFITLDCVHYVYIFSKKLILEMYLKKIVDYFYIK